MNGAMKKLMTRLAAKPNQLLSTLRVIHDAETGELAFFCVAVESDMLIFGLGDFATAVSSRRHFSLPRRGSGVRAAH